MAFSKANLYRHDLQLTAAYFRSMCHPARLQIIEQLSSNGASSVEELLIDHPLSETAFSDHLKTLRSMHLVKYMESYPYIIYSVNGKNLISAQEYMKDYFESLFMAK